MAYPAHPPTSPIGSPAMRQDPRLWYPYLQTSYMPPFPKAQSISATFGAYTHPTDNLYLANQRHLSRHGSPKRETQKHEKQGHELQKRGVAKQEEFGHDLASTPDRCLSPPLRSQQPRANTSQPCRLRRTHRNSAASISAASSAGGTRSAGSNRKRRKNPTVLEAEAAHIQPTSRPTNLVPSPSSKDPDSVWKCAHVTRLLVCLRDCARWWVWSGFMALLCFRLMVWMWCLCLGLLLYGGVCAWFGFGGPASGSGEDGDREHQNASIGEIRYENGGLDSLNVENGEWEWEMEFLLHNRAAHNSAFDIPPSPTSVVCNVGSRRGSQIAAEPFL